MANSNVKIIPQKFSFSQPGIKNGKGEIIKPTMNVTIKIDALKADKTEIKKDLEKLFTEVLDYFK